MELSGKTLLVISPQAWGRMRLAKHHYALELARAGNDVYFLNPPLPGVGTDKVEIVPSGIEPTLYLIDHTLYFPFEIRFKWMGLFHFLMGYHIQRLRKRIGGNIDIVWSFDLGNYYPFRFFGEGTLNIYHCVDEPGSREGLEAARGAHVIFSVTREILAKFEAFPACKYLLQHGLPREFSGVEVSPWEPRATLRVGMSGNWLRPDLDRETLCTIIRRNPQIDFHLWGCYETERNNVGGMSDDAAAGFIRFVRNSSNVLLHGPVDTAELVSGFRNVDAFLICYDVEKDQSRGTNYHKVMEYLSTGRVIVANNISAYDNDLRLVEMCRSRRNNEELPELFAAVMRQLQHYNDQVQMDLRRNFALNNLYPRKIREIERVLRKRHGAPNWGESVSRKGL